MYEKGGLEYHHPAVQCMDTKSKLNIALMHMNERLMLLTAENAQLKVENARLRAEALANSVAEQVLAEHCSVGSE